jgi:hypothetical protein
MSKRKRSAGTIKIARRQLLNRLFHLSQLDLFYPENQATRRAIAELRAGIAAATRELEDMRRF